jgi:hypothetical protein
MEETGWLPSLYYGASAAYRMSQLAKRSSTEIYDLSINGFLQAQGQMIDQLHMEISRQRSMDVMFERLSGKDKLYDSRLQIQRSPRHHKQRWVDGTPENASVAIGLADMFPDARFIFLLREPRDVICSLLNFSTAGGRDYSFSEAADTWERFAQYGSEACEVLGDRIYLLQYNLLLENTEDVLIKLWRFLDEAIFKKSVETFSRKINSSSQKEGRQFSLVEEAHISRLDNIYRSIVDGMPYRQVSWEKLDSFVDRRNDILNGWLNRIS